MEEFTQKWAIISLLEDIEESTEFYYTDTPLHLTLAGVFKIDKDGNWLADELGKLLARQKPIEMQAYEKAMFGTNQDIAVMKIIESPDLMNLHRTIHEWLEASGCAYNEPQYQGNGYVPHSTFQKRGSLVEDEIRLIKSVSLIDLYPNHDGYQRKIFKTFDLHK
jgi:2'-5' RNA ligase